MVYIRNGVKGMYKLSKFNYYQVFNNELLLFNTLNGPNSLCKFTNILELNNNLEKLNEKEIKKLVDRGIIINDDIDECNLLEKRFYEFLYPNDFEFIVNVTENCNFLCKYCFESHEKIIIDTKTEENICSYILKNIDKYNKINISWFGGEPLLYINKIEAMSNELLRICKNYRRKYSASITTNGYLLNIENFEKLLNLKVNLFQITLDGIESIHDYQRPLVNGGKSFETIINNLMQIKNSKHKGFRIIIRSNITRKIMPHIEEYLSLLEELSHNDDRFCVMIFNVGEWSDNLGSDIKNDLLKDYDVIKSIYENVIDTNRKINFLFPLHYLSCGCNIARNNRYLVRPDGSLYKCSVNFQNEKNKVGYLNEGKIIENYQKIYKLGKCEKLYDCFFSPLCKGNSCPSASKSTCPIGKYFLGYYLIILNKYKEFEIINEERKYE